MKVSLKRPWFAPDGSQRAAGVHDNLPKEWETLLPSTAKVLTEAAPVAEVVDKTPLKPTK